ncbi:hypothetical protein J3459_010240 [Metarhizium acridum]|nr:hypothetical protein J3459_010240 [Metarhizium acridum]
MTTGSRPASDSKPYWSTIGDGRRPVLGTYAPQTDGSPQQRGWLPSSISGHVAGTIAAHQGQAVACLLGPGPLSRRLGKVPCQRKGQSALKRRPQSQPSDPILSWTGRQTLTKITGSNSPPTIRPFLTLTKMCNRCPSLNVDYDTGKIAEGERGTVLKKLMSDRRVDTGAKYSPVFGKYGFLNEGQENMVLAVGDQIAVTKRAHERPILTGPCEHGVPSPQFYQAS